MPRQKLFGEEEFNEFEAELTKLGFHRKSDIETKSDTEREGLVPPPNRDLRGVTFTFTANHLEVVVKSTYAEEEKKARKNGAGWVMIMEGDKKVYSTRAKHRTRNFLVNLLEAATVAQSRVINRPLCPKCKAYMYIRHGKGLKSRFWQCSMSAHPRPVSLSWDHGLPPEILKIVHRIRRIRQPWVDKLAAIGKKPGAAMMKRGKWKKSRPENQV